MDFSRPVILIIAIILLSALTLWLLPRAIKSPIEKADLVFECPVGEFTAICGYDIENSEKFILYQIKNGNISSPNIELPNQLFAKCQQPGPSGNLSLLVRYCSINMQSGEIVELGISLPVLKFGFASNERENQARTCHPYHVSAAGPYINAICTAQVGTSEFTKQSPDGYNTLDPVLNSHNELAFICEDLFAFRWEPFRHLCTMRLDGSEFQEITPKSLQVHSFSLNDHGEIVFLCEEFANLENPTYALGHSQYGLCMTDISGQNPRKLEQPFVFASDPVLNNSGDIAIRCQHENYDSDNNRQYSVCIFPADASDPYLIDLKNEINVTSVDLNDDGVIAFGCVINNSENFNEVCIINLDGSGFRQLTFDDSMIRRPDLR